MLILLLKKYYLQIYAVVATLICVFLALQPKPEVKTVTKTEYVDKVVTKEVEKIVTRDVIKWRDRVQTRTITKPGGTTIVEVTKETSGESDKSQGVEKEASKDTTVTQKTETVVTRPANPSFLVGGSLFPNGTPHSLFGAYRPLDAFPVYVGGGITKIDASYKPIFTIGVTL